MGGRYQQQVETIHFTPSLKFGGASVGMTYSIQTGHAWVVGDWVEFEIVMTLTNAGTSAGVATVEGLPIPSLAGSGYPYRRFDLLNPGAYPLFGTYLETVSRVPAGTSRVDLFWNVDGALQQLTDINISASDIRINGRYKWR